MITELIIEKRDNINKIPLRTLNIMYPPREGWSMELGKETVIISR